MTSDSSSSPPPSARTVDNDPEVDAMRRLQREMVSAEERHHAQMRALWASPAMRVGTMLVDLRRPIGWRKAPRRIRELVGGIRGRARIDREPASWTVGPVVPARAETALSFLDEFSHACFAHEIVLIPASRDRWQGQIGAAHFVFAESAWNASGGGWQGAFSRFGQKPAMEHVLADARARGIPSVFWNKEDPVHFDQFLPVARAFDHVFTTDANVVENYRSALGHDRVHALTFAAQPRIHNPMGRIQGVNREICFAGSWRGGQYPERVAMLTELLHGAVDAGDLVIYDRQAGSDAVGGFEGADFGPWVRGTLDYATMLQRYRTHGVFLNTNSVLGSPTMLARRVFELLACRTPVVSTPSEAVDALFGDLVPSPSTRADAADVLESLMDPDTRDRLGQRGMRHVLSRHTYAHRMADILGAVGIEAPVAEIPSVDVILVSNRPEQTGFALDSFRRQDHPRKRLIFVTNSDAFDLDDVRRRIAEFPDSVHLNLPPERTLGECLNAALDVSTSDWFAKFDDDDWYGEAYLSDMLLARLYTDAPILGKRTNYVYLEGSDRTVLRFAGREFQTVSTVQGGTLLVRRDALGSIRFASLPRGTDSRFLEDCTAAGLDIFSTDRFNFMLHRRADPASHTWTIEDDEILRGTSPVGPGVRTDVAWV